MDQKTKNQRLKNQRLKALVDAFIKQHGGRDALINSLRRNPRAVRASWENYLYQRLRNLPNITEEDYSTAHSYLKAATYPAWDFAENNILHFYQGNSSQTWGGTRVAATSGSDNQRGGGQRRQSGANLEQAVVPAPAPNGVRPPARPINAAPKMVGEARAKEPQEEQVRQENNQQGGLQMEPNGQNGQFAGYPIANVFRDFYGGNVNEAYQWSASDETGPDNKPIRRIRVFRNPDDKQTHFYFEPDPEGGWALKHISGETIATGLVYNPKERRFYVTNDVPPEQMLQALRRFQSGGTTETNGTPNAGDNRRVPGAVQFLDLGQGQYIWVGLDGKIHYGRRSGDGTMISERSIPLQQLFEAPSAQQATPESSMNWLMTVLPLLLLILARR